MPITWFWVYIFSIHTDHRRQNRKVLPRVWWQEKRSASISRENKQWITQGNFHPINLSLPILLYAGNFHSWKMQKKTSVLFSVDLFRLCNWCHQPTKKDIKLVFGSKMVYDVFNLLGNPVVPCWGRGGLPGSPSLCWPGHNSVHHYCNSEGFKSFWCDWTAWYRFLTVHVWWKKCAITTDYEWFHLGSFLWNSLGFCFPVVTHEHHKSNASVALAKCQPQGLARVYRNYLDGF